MIHPLRLLYLCAWVSFILPAAAPVTSFAQDYSLSRILVFSKTLLYRHASITNGIAALKQLGQEHNFAVDATEDPALFTPGNLARYNVVVFLSTSGEVLDASQQRAFQSYIENGGGLVGIHAGICGSVATAGNWRWYAQVCGTEFSNHKAIAPATVVIEDPANASVAHLPSHWTRTDEWYNFVGNPRGNVHVLARLDEASFPGGTMGYDHPIAWCRQAGKGRFWYTALGHTEASYREPQFLAHLYGGIQIAAGTAPADFSPNADPRFHITVLAADPHDPMELAVAKDGQVFFIERLGALKRCQPGTSRSMTVGKLNVFETLDNGLLGLALDPDFLQNHWLYLCYSPPEASENRVSRFTLFQDRLDLPSEKILLRIPVQREQPICHTGGSLTFDAQGNLYISTGDNTNPFASDGFSPSDERPGRAPWDAQGSSANRNDLRGKILRIHPNPDGTVSIPQGGLFPADGSNGRPEVYVMGCRNPYRFSVDHRTGFVYWGDVGPDANAPNPDRGPAGFDEINQARAAGNFGWPYFVADNKPYRKYDFANKTSGALWDPAKPINNSPNNTGAHELPPAQPAFIAYPYSPSTRYPEVGSGGRSAMAGPVYYFDPELASARKLPRDLDHSLFIYDWMRSWIIAVKLDRDERMISMKRFLPGVSWKRPMDLELGADGALYLLEWGTQYNGNNSDARILRIDSNLLL